MREIVVLQVGGGGNKIGSKFWEIIADEHGVQPDGQYAGQSDLQLERVNVYFCEAIGGRFVPRSINVDMDQATEQIVRSSPYGMLFRPDGFVQSSHSAGNSFARARYTDGADLALQAMDVVRKEVEACDLIQGFQIIHTTGGGCGAGLTTLLIDALKTEYDDRVINTFSVIPSPKTSEIVVENYNAILALQHLASMSDETVIIDNEALYYIVNDLLKIQGSSFHDYNHMISACIGGITACFRFPGQLNSDLRKLATNMVPFPRLHFFAPAFVPLAGRGEQKYFNLTVPLLVQQMYDPKYLQAACNPAKGKYLCCASIFRGLMKMSEVEECMWQARNKSSTSFVEWIPNSTMTAVCDIPPRGMKLAATFLGNTTAISEVFKRCLDSFSIMFKRSANLHWYTNEGMEKEDFVQAENAITDLIAEYHQCQEGSFASDEPMPKASGSR